MKMEITKIAQKLKGCVVCVHACVCMFKTYAFFGQGEK